MSDIYFSDSEKTFQFSLYYLMYIIFSEYMQYTSTGCAEQAENTLLENIISLKKKKKGKNKA